MDIGADLLEPSTYKSPELRRYLVYAMEIAQKPVGVRRIFVAYD